MIVDAQTVAEPSPGFRIEDFLPAPHPPAPSCRSPSRVGVSGSACIVCNYPFFHRPSFQDAYDNLWLSRDQPGNKLSELNIGLGNQTNSSSHSAVFACALNIIFAICSFFGPSTSSDWTLGPSGSSRRF
ncbi:hypothetical protein BO70DRAFT_393449 [Aspergillus heteromorphus CBS 117.55]|uniref:Uncharacterized protein n=1 Tax=Aspergillus heteromorphus CBS 117.55 TaxID=1448321 RepID=A0A317WUF8_9EURO|nr:uncharacterized protein BO70DRAFT_393449 [Aspergillus heteromorphus CBS 117.55]PWY88932.1 hypothetical protein BO70DRAFT_393449 [Aspergillus heteromorphus CBS 117.55]